MHGSSVTYDAAGFDCHSKRGLRDRLNIISVAEAHVTWKNRLGNHVRGISREPLVATLLGQDGVCQLGSLINGAAFAVLREWDEYRQLSVAHQQFHQLARVVVEKLQADDHDGAETLFKNEYSFALRDIIQSLSKINRLLLE
jgi:hypothetical protein